VKVERNKKISGGRTRKGSWGNGVKAADEVEGGGEEDENFWSSRIGVSSSMEEGEREREMMERETA